MSIKLIDLYTRIVETTGLDIVTIGSLRTSISNCFADLTARGYKLFKELSLPEYDSNNKETSHGLGNPVYIDETMAIFELPKNISKIVYIRLYFENGAMNIDRVSLSNKRVGNKYINGKFRSTIEYGKAIFYTKEDKLYIEWHPSCGADLVNVAFGYYEKLFLDPTGFPVDANDSEKLKTYELNVREEFEDAIVFYTAYFYYARYVKDTDKINHYLNQYKYYVEDITHELAYEDEYNEEDAVIKTEE